MNNFTAMDTIVSDVMIQFVLLENWSRGCNISQTGLTDFNIVCFIKGNSNLKFADFRNLTSRLSSNIKLDLFVNCDNGQIRFPWPFRADKLNRIYIKNCIIKDYLTEFKNSLIDSIPDTIKYLQIENVTIIYNVRELYDSLSKANSSLTKAAECGPENAYSIIQRRTRDIFEDIHNASHFTDFFNVLTDHSHYFSIQKRTCMYNNLEVFELSGMKNLEKSSIDKIVYTDIADNLKILNFSGNGIYYSLHKLQGWRLRFPRMEYLDFSDNNIKSLPFIRDYGRGIKGIKSVGIIDVRRNKITALTKAMIDSFSTYKFVKADISENPFLCDCGIIEAMEYLSSKTMPKAYDYLGSLECANPIHVRGRQLLSLSRADLNCTRKKETIINVSILAISIVAIIVSIVTFFAIYFRILIKKIVYTRLNIKCPCQFKNGINDI
ncbi:toll-like receptor 6 [Mytilus edulis]|uniref:toll-like receptor 6 n=1 Tax=Mytilus edulis TaxID=6550 RepID=UPI0039EFDB7E